MRQAGRIVALTLQAVTEAAAPGVTTRELDALAAETIAAHGATSNFLGYGGDVGPPFPGVICTSINEQTIHGIPGDRELWPGDLLKIDCGAIVEGWHADAATTVAIGEIPVAWTELMRVTKGALDAGIEAMGRGERVNDISCAIENYVDGQGSYGIVKGYFGHGIGTQLHMKPDVPNQATRRRSPRLRPGMVLAIEPMIVLGSPKVAELRDQWTVSTIDRSVGAHYEHTVALTEYGTEILTVL